MDRWRVRLNAPRSIITAKPKPPIMIRPIRVRLTKRSPCRAVNELYSPVTLPMRSKPALQKADML